MSPLAHRLYIGTLVTIVICVTIYLFVSGIPYYATSLEERFYHPDHQWLKPSGAFGHGLGIVGTLLILVGVFGYIARKRYKFLSRLGRLKYWLEFHIFLCVLGPIMILFHTAFKFGGIVSVSFWSMVAVVASGVIGRFIYIQIPRTINGRELSLSEIREMRRHMEESIKEEQHLNEAAYQEILEATNKSREKLEGPLITRVARKFLRDRGAIRSVRSALKRNGLAGSKKRRIIRLVKKEIALSNRITRLQTMRRLFKYWHVAHLPFAIVMLIIMVIHVGVTLAFGYRWIF